jgi:hypothetical protein
MVKIIGLVLSGMIVMCGSACADEFYFVSPGTTTWNGVYVNPYQANDNTQPLNNPLTVYCDDWNTDFSGNPTWTANVYTLTASNASYFKYGNTVTNYNLTLSGHTLSYNTATIPTAFTRYLEAAYLDQQWEAELASNDSSDIKTMRQKELAAAAWTLFVDANHVSGLIGAINSSSDTIASTTYHYADDVFGYLAQAKAAVLPDGPFNGAGWDVIVPVGNNSNGGPMQEFLVHGFSGNTSVPEPSAIILLGTVIGYLGLTKVRQRQRA